VADSGVVVTNEAAVAGDVAVAIPGGSGVPVGPVSVSTNAIIAVADAWASADPSSSDERRKPNQMSATPAITTRIQPAIAIQAHPRPNWKFVLSLIVHPQNRLWKTR
jgi:hypothetical protein